MLLVHFSSHMSTAEALFCFGQEPGKYIQTLRASPPEHAANFVLVAQRKNPNIQQLQGHQHRDASEAITSLQITSLAPGGSGSI